MVEVQDSDGHQPSEKRHSRDYIIESVWKVVAEQGFPGVTMRSVAKRADVSLGRVQYYFSSKDELVLESCKALVAAVLAGETATDAVGAGKTEAKGTFARKCNAAAESKNSIDQLKSLLGAVIPQTKPAQRMAIVWHAYVAQAMVQPALANIVVAAKRDKEQAVARVLLSLSAQGAGGESMAGLEQEEATSIARTLMAIADGLAQRVLTGDVAYRGAIDLLNWEIDGVFVD